ncbi:hypothetical protein ACVWZV_004498 [Bradyrhizobium sp. GM5.1]
MKRARFTEEQIIAVSKEHEAGSKTFGLARKHGISEATIYNWKANSAAYTIIVDPSAPVEAPPANGSKVVGTPTPATTSMPRQRLRSIPLQRAAFRQIRARQNATKSQAVDSESGDGVLPCPDLPESGLLDRNSLQT